LKDYEQAATQLQTAYHFYLFLGEPFGLSQAQLGLARLARWRGDFEEAAAKLTAAQEGVKGRVSKRTEFLRGLIACEQAALFVTRDEVEQATESYNEASRLLKSTERG